jgi:arylsulfatase A
MTHQTTSKWILLFLLTFAFFDAGKIRAANTDRQPNILLIMADDLGFETVNCYGGTSYKTPNIDALAKTGIRFANAFATPLCSPSRVELMTGRYGFRTTWINLIGRGKKGEVNDYFDPKKETTFGQMLKDAGYATAIAGKWQLCDFPSNPNHLKECGFDKSLCWAWMVAGKQTSRYWAPVLWADGKLEKVPADKYGDDLFSDYLINFMKEHRDGPFFAYYPMALVHAPHVPPPGSPRAQIAIEAAAHSDNWKKRRNHKTENGNVVEEKINDPANFPDMVAYMDRTVGKMMAALDELGLRDNTLVIFTGDNGTDRRITSMLGNVAIRGGKGTVTEVGAHVPLIASWPGKIPANKVNDKLVDFSDILPTLAEVGGAKLPANKIDGHSFARLLQGKRGGIRDWVFTQLGDQRLARDDRYMLHDDGRIYDIRNDLLETNNLADSGKWSVNRAKKRLQKVLDANK